MLKRRRPELQEAVEELSKSREGMNMIAGALNAAYDAYIRTARLEDAYEAFVAALESTIGDAYEE